MKAVLQKLIVLQEIDNQLAAIEARKGSLPQQVEKLESTAQVVASELDQSQAAREENDKELTGIGSQLTDLNAKLKKYQDQLYLVTTNREYDALTNEIESVKEELESLQQRKQELQSQNEELASSIEELEKQAGTLSTDLDRNRSDLSDKTAATEARQAELEKRRTALAAELSQRYLRKYERILRARGHAVVPLQRQACGGCHKQLSPQKQYEIRRMDRMIECENCGRILIHIPAETQE